jgi:hypothetical protein
MFTLALCYVYPHNTAEWHCPVIYTVIIKDKDQRLRFAADVEKILKDYKTFIPGRNRSELVCDMGVTADVDLDTLAQVEALIDRRGYQVIKEKSPVKPGLSLSNDSPQVER